MMRRIIKADDSGRTAEVKADMLNLADFAAEARRIVLDARKDAARIVSEARAKSESVRRQARQQGYAEGFARGQADGHTDGLQQARVETGRTYAAQYADVLGLVRRIAAELADAHGGILHDGAGQVLDLAVLLAEKVVTTVAIEDIDTARTNLAKVLEMAHGGGQVIVNVNPDQLGALRKDFTELADALSLGGAVQLVGDKRVAPGGVVLSSRNGVIDATIETQLANIARGLLGRDVRREQAHDRPAEIGRYEPVDPSNCPGEQAHEPFVTEMNHEDV